MTVTTSYAWNFVTNADFLNTATVGHQNAVALALRLDGGVAAAWNGAGTSQVRGASVGADGTIIVSDAVLNFTTAGDQFDPDIVVLPNGRYVVSYTDGSPGGGDTDVRHRIFNANGTPVGGDVPHGLQGHRDAASSLTVLSNGAFVVAWATEMKPGERTLSARVFDANGAALTDQTPLFGFTDQNANNPAIAGLAGGGFVAVWEQNTVGGTATSIRMQRFNDNAVAVGGAVTLDNIGTVNKDAQVLALPDGGFVVAYVDNGWALDGTEISARVYNADGSTRGGFIQVNADDAGVQDKPALTLLSNGMWSVAWNSSGVTKLATFTGNGTRVPVETSVAATVEADIVGLDDGLLMLARESTVTDGSGSSIRYSVHGLTRTQASDGAGDVLNGDDLRDLMFGAGGDDILSGGGAADELNGGEGDDTLNGGTGDDRVHGGAGDDLFIVGANFADVQVRFVSGAVVIQSAFGIDTVKGVERFQFTDRTIVRDQADGVDDLFYYAQRPDVLAAGVDADDHFANNGRFEGMAPNALFDAAWYLARNPDVAAAGLDPFEHYMTSGWLEGRDPSAAFDTSAYLAAHPDVAAAGLNPLLHYLSVGADEGRVRSPLFDDAFYLLKYPDVAAAGLDPFAHYRTSGLHEGRDPNPWFDADGYLAAYADVAAAGWDPLEHYLLHGWNEGRDPSQAFDTTSYLAAYQDVAAAGMNPLVHYLTSGYFEGRSTFSDGVWG